VLIFEGYCLKDTICFELVKGLPAAFVTLIIGIIAASVAYRQYRTARAKLNLDLYDRRFELFDTTWGFLSSIVQGDLVRQKDHREILNNLLPSARFLFGEEIASYLDKIISLHIELFKLTNRQLEVLQLTDSEQGRILELEEYFRNEVKIGVKEKFGGYLDFSHWK